MHCFCPKRRQWTSSDLHGEGQAVQLRDFLLLLLCLFFLRLLLLILLLCFLFLQPSSSSSFSFLLVFKDVTVCELWIKTKCLVSIDTSFYSPLTCACMYLWFSRCVFLPVQSFLRPVSPSACSDFPSIRETPGFFFSPFSLGEYFTCFFKLFCTAACWSCSQVQRERRTRRRWRRPCSLHVPQPITNVTLHLH